MQMTKADFVKRMALLQNFSSQQQTLGLVFEKVLIDGWAIVTFGNSLVEELINSTIREMDIEDKDILSWWLYEDVEKVIYIDEKPIEVQSAEQLYDYLVNGNIAADQTKCPDCGIEIEHSSGCISCHVCGYSSCNN